MGTPPMSMSRTFPEAPKSMVAVARGPLPSQESTLPSPYLSCVTLSPGANSSAGADGFARGIPGELRDLLQGLS